MAKRCTRCGNFLMDDERFCTKCGENVSNIPPEGAPQASPDNSFGRNDGYSSPYAQTGAPNPGYPPYAPPAYQQPAQDEMSLGKWVGTIVVTTFFGIISLIFLFVWGFGDGPECRKRYCKAMLICMLIGLGVAIVVWIVIFAMLGNIFNSAFADYINRMRDIDYGQIAAAFIG